MALQNFAIDLSVQHWLIVCLRLLLAALLGALIGWERKQNLKAAGLRTHIFVCCGAALFMILSKYAFVDMVDANGVYYAGMKEADPARIAAQVVSGIGFLGAGVIFKNGVNIKGLTTAAGLWATAGVGMAIGSGMIVTGVFAALFIAILQFSMHKHTVGVDSYSITSIKLVVREEDTSSRTLTDFTNDFKAVITASKIKRLPDSTIEYTLKLKTPGDFRYERIDAFLREHKDIISIENAS